MLPVSGLARYVMTMISLFQEVILPTIRWRHTATPHRAITPCTLCPRVQAQHMVKAQSTVWEQHTWLVAQAQYTVVMEVMAQCTEVTQHLGVTQWMVRMSHTHHSQSESRTHTHTHRVVHTAHRRQPPTITAHTRQPVAAQASRIILSLVRVLVLDIR